MDLVPAMSPTAACLAVLLFTGVAAPIAGLLFRSLSSGWETIGGGPFAIESEPPSGGEVPGPGRPVDAAIQAAEVRQMLEAKVNRLQRRGEAPIDVEAETARLLAEEGEAPDPEPRIDAELRAEVRQLVIVGNERRLRRRLEPLDVEAETRRRLEDFVGSQP